MLKDKSIELVPFMEEYYQKFMEIRNREVIRNYIGNITYHDVDWKNRNCEIAICIGNEGDRNKGLGTEAVGVLLYFLFNEMNLHRVNLEVYDFNVRAIR